jgi:tetratricopeptide (TPR) repeat protein
MVEANKHIFSKHFLGFMRLVYAVLILLLALMTSAQSQKTAEDWFNKGNDFYDRGAYDLAIKCYDEVILIDPNLATAWNILFWSRDHLLVKHIHYRLAKARHPSWPRILESV